MLIETQNEVLAAIEKADKIARHPLHNIQVHDGTGLSETQTTSLFESNKPFLLTDVDEATKVALFKTIGIKAAGSAPYLLVLPIGEIRGRKVYHLIESANEIKKTVLSFTESSGKFEGPAPATIPAPETDQTGGGGAPEKTLLEQFADAVIRLWDVKAPMPEDDGPETHIWIYSKQYSRLESGEKWKNYTPPTQTVNGYVTYTFQAFLDIAETGNFQWLYSSVLGAWDTNVMVENNHDERGWGNGAINVSMPTPSSDFAYYDCSPKNANNVSTVTTEVGFEVGYQTGSLSYSQSKTEQLSDWKVTLNTINNWTYQMSSPYKGNSSKFPSDAIKYNAGKARYEIKSWPALTTNTFNWETMSVWRTSKVLTNTITVKPTISYRPNFIHIKNEWPTWKGSYWAAGSDIPDVWHEAFQLDMSIVS